MTRSGADPRHRFVRLAAVIRADCELLSRVVVEARDASARFQSASPSSLELRGLGDVLHDFYTGAERIFTKIAMEMDGGLPAGDGWHRQLLDNMTLELPGIRPPVLGPQTVNGLAEYLRFRHLYRNLYGFELEWPRVRSLLKRVPKIWRPLDRDLQGFLEFLASLAD